MLQSVASVYFLTSLVTEDPRRLDLTCNLTQMPHYVHHAHTLSTPVGGAGMYSDIFIYTWGQHFQFGYIGGFQKTIFGGDMKIFLGHH